VSLLGLMEAAARAGFQALSGRRAGDAN